LAAFAACLALAAWTRPRANGDNNAVTMLQGDPDNLEQIRWQSDRVDIVVKKLPAHIAVDIAQATEDKTPQPKKTFVGTQQAEELFTSLMPLKAARSLGKLPDDRLKALGLDEPKTTLTLSMRRGDQIVSIGNATYGSGDLYAKLANGEVYLMAAGPLSGLRSGGASLQDRRVLAVDRTKITQVTLVRGSQKRQFLQRFAQDSTRAHFADPAEPEKAMQQASLWLDRVFRLSVIDTQELPPQGPPAITLTFESIKQPPVTLSLWPTVNKVALARSSQYNTTLILSQTTVETLLQDLESVLSENHITTVPAEHDLDSTSTQQ
jgi:hypothetical protein